MKNQRIIWLTQTRNYSSDVWNYGGGGDLVTVSDRSDSTFELGLVNVYKWKNSFLHVWQQRIRQWRWFFLKVNKKQQQQRIVANRPGILTLNSRNATISQMILELLERWYAVTLQIPPLREERQMTNLYTVIRCSLVGRTLSEGER